MSALGKRLAALEQSTGDGRVVYAWCNDGESAERAIERTMAERGIVSRTGYRFIPIAWMGTGIARAPA